jgi:Zn-dependent protease with chaperone function
VSPAAAEGAPDAQVHKAAPSTDSAVEKITREVNEKLERELSAISPAAVPVLREANQARDAKQHQRAADLYARVRQLAPTFTAAARRQCGALLELGRRKEGLLLCREAARDGHPDNLSSLANALVDRSAGKPGDAELTEALGLAERAVALAPNDFWTHAALCEVAAAKADNGLLARCTERLEAIAPAPVAANFLAVRASVLGLPQHGPASQQALTEADLLVQRAVKLLPGEPALYKLSCQIAINRNDLEGLRRCTAKLSELAPDDPATGANLAILAASEGRHGQAREEVEKARANGLDPQIYDDLSAGLDEARPFHLVWGSRAAWLLGGWLGCMALLVAVGAALSRTALAAAARPPAEESGRAQGMEATLRRAYAFVLMLCCGYYYLSIPIVALIVIGLAAGLVLGIFAIGFIPIKLLLIIGVVAFITLAAIAKSLFVKVRDEDPGLRLDLAEHPRLKSVLEEVAAKVGTHPVNTVFITPGVDVAVFERGRMLAQMRGKAERCLLLGVAVLDGMRLTELKSILAHEYGHFSNRDTAGGGFALAVRRSLLTMAVGIAQGGAASWYNPAWLFINGYHRVFLIISHGASRLQEVLADRWAAFAYGSLAFENGLRHVIERSVRFDAHAQATLNEVVEHRLALANLYSYQPKSGIDQDAIEQQLEEALEREPSAYDSHPSPKERIAWVRALGAEGESGASDEPAWAVFSDREALELAMTDQVRSNVADNLGVAIPAKSKKKKAKRAEETAAAETPEGNTRGDD